MPKYLVDGELHVKYRLTVLAESDVRAKEEIKEQIFSFLCDPSDPADKAKIIVDHKINPTVEVIQEN